MKQTEKLISEKEAWSLFEHSTTETMHRVSLLHNTFNENCHRDADMYFNFLSLLSFCYETGRVHGIQEERARKKGK